MPVPPIIVNIPYDPWWTQFAPAAVGAVLGAVATAAPLFILARRASRETLKRDDEARRRAEVASAAAVMTHLMTLVNGVGSLRDTVEQMIMNADRWGDQNAELWTKIKPIPTVTGEVRRFNTTDLAIVFRAGEAALANDLMLLAERCSSIECGLIDYDKRRAELEDALAPYTRKQGSKGVTNVPMTAMETIGPLKAEVDQAAHQLRALLNADADAAIKLAVTLAKAMRLYFKDATFLEVNFDRRTSGTGNPYRSIS